MTAGGRRRAPLHHRTRTRRTGHGATVVSCACGVAVIAWADVLGPAGAATAAERMWRIHTGRPDIADGCCGCRACTAPAGQDGTLRGRE